MKRFYKLYFLVALLLMLAFKAADRPVKVWMIGDSTMCLYGPERAPLTGWGMPFANFFDNTVQFENRAKGGRSTRTFISESRWQPIVDSLSADDYILIQFGHNDEAKEEKYKDRYTTVGDYKKNLIKFITESRLKKAIPVLITPVSRMKFDAAGNAEETHPAYTAAVYAVAKQYETPLIDLDKASRELFQELGPQRTKMLFMQIAPDVNPIYPEGKKDNTHFNELGAREIAQLVLREIRKLKIGLKTHIINSAKKE